MNVTVSDLSPANILERVKNVQDGVATSEEATRARLATLEITHRPPMTPAEVDTFRPTKNAVGTQDEARVLAHRIGLKELEPVLRRLINAERIIAEQATQIHALQTTVLQLKHGK